MKAGVGVSSTPKLDARIKGKLDELAKDREDRDRVERVLARVDARVDEVRDELRRIRRVIARRREVLKDLRADLKELEAKTPDEDTAEEAKLRERLDHLAGLHEEAIALRDRLLMRLDRLSDRSDDAKKALQEIVDEHEEDRQAYVRLKRKRQRIREQRAKKDQPSEHFTYAEFDCNDGTPVPEAAKPAIKALCRDVLEPARARFGTIHINSGYRTESWNRQVGGESNSVHRYDLHPGAAAADWTAQRGSARDWYEFTAGKADGRGLYSTFHHADNRNRIGWPDSTWTG